MKEQTVNRVNQMKRFLKGSYPKILRFAHCGLNAKDNLQESLEWYQKTFRIYSKR